MTNTDTEKNLLIKNWEYLDGFLSEYEHRQNKEDEKHNGFFARLFNVRGERKTTPTLNIIREKLWLYYYKENFKKALLPI